MCKTIDFDAGLVNGLEGNVVGCGPYGVSIAVKFGVVTIWRTPRSYINAQGVEFFRMAYEIDLAYATTVHQVEGQTLSAVCVVFESFSPPGWQL